MANDNSINYYIRDNASGIISADTSVVLSAVQSEWRSALGNSLSIDASTPQGRMMELQAAERKLVLTINCLTANQINPNYATGQYLDALASLSGVERRGATKTIVNATIAGEPGTTIGAGFIAQTEAGDLFTTQTDYTIEESGTVPNVQFFSVESGAIPAVANTLTQIVTPVAGVASVNNPAPPQSVGAPLESDYKLRRRVQESHYVGTALDGALISRINAIPDVVSYWFYDNRKGAPVWVRMNGEIVDTDPEEATAVEVDAHSIILVIEGGDDEAIGKALFSARSAGCGRTSAASPATVTTVSFPEFNGAFYVTRTEIFNRPASVNLYASVTVKKNTYTGTVEDLENDILSAISAWTSGDVEGVDKPQIGATISTYEIGAAISKQIPEIMIADVQIGTTSSNLSNDAITMSKVQIAKFPADNISIIIQ